MWGKRYLLVALTYWGSSKYRLVLALLLYLGYTRLHQDPYENGVEPANPIGPVDPLRPRDWTVRFRAHPLKRSHRDPLEPVKFQGRTMRLQMNTVSADEETYYRLQLRLQTAIVGWDSFLNEC